MVWTGIVLLASGSSPPSRGDRSLKLCRLQRPEFLTEGLRSVRDCLGVRPHRDVDDVRPDTGPNFRGGSTPKIQEQSAEDPFKSAPGAKCACREYPGQRSRSRPRLGRHGLGWGQRAEKGHKLPGQLRRKDPPVGRHASWPPVEDRFKHCRIGSTVPPTPSDDAGRPGAFASSRMAALAIHHTEEGLTLLSGGGIARERIDGVDRHGGRSYASGEDPWLGIDSRDRSIRCLPIRERQDHDRKGDESAGVHEPSGYLPDLRAGRTPIPCLLDWCTAPDRGCSQRGPVYRPGRRLECRPRGVPNHRQSRHTPRRTVYRLAPRT